jgi:hypothetical protein
MKLNLKNTAKGLRKEGFLNLRGEAYFHEVCLLIEKPSSFAQEEAFLFFKIQSKDYPEYKGK